MDFFVKEDKKTFLMKSNFVILHKIRMMKFLAFFLVLFVSFYSCKSGKTTIKGNSETTTQVVDTDTIRIANDALEYEIIIIEVGFDNWIATQPPMGHYGLSYLESRNRIYVIEYNNRVYQDRTRRLYEEEINYNPNVSYGLEVNYLLYNYFEYFQKKYKQKL